MRKPAHASAGTAFGSSRLSGDRLSRRGTPPLRRKTFFPRAPARDAKPDNFLVGGTDLYGIDIHAGFRNLVEYDLAQFLGQMLVSMGSRVFRRPHPRAAALEAAVLRGYRSLGRIDEEALRWLRVYFLLSLWLNAPSAGHVQRWLLRPLLLHELQRQLGGVLPDRRSDTTGDELGQSKRNRLGRQYALPRHPGRP